MEENIRRFVTVFLMWSETVSMINLQTLISILKSAQKCAIFTFKIEKFSVEGHGPPHAPPIRVPSVRTSRQHLWIRHWLQLLMGCIL